MVEFPKFRDGQVRGRLGYKGDEPAIGHVLSDQFAFLVECGWLVDLTYWPTSCIHAAADTPLCHEDPLDDE